MSPQEQVVRPSVSPVVAAHRFELAVLLIAAGLKDKEDRFRVDPRAYPYSHRLRKGLSIFLALAAQYDSTILAKVSHGLGESDFIRQYCVCEPTSWIANWPDEVRNEVCKGDVGKVGPLACVEGDFFSVAPEALEMIARYKGASDITSEMEERKVYEFLTNESQEHYTLGRRFLIRHPVLTSRERLPLTAGNYPLSDDPLFSEEEQNVPASWLDELVRLAYDDKVPADSKICPSCGWTMTMPYRQPHCIDRTCTAGMRAQFESLGSVESGSWRLRSGIMRYIALPGKLELEIAEAAKQLGFDVRLWPHKDLYDVQITHARGIKLAVDAKTFGNVDWLARSLRDDPLSNHPEIEGAEVVYVVPNGTGPKHAANLNALQTALVNKDNVSCCTLKQLVSRLKKEVRNV